MYVLKLFFMSLQSVHCYHLLVKHRDVRRPSSWREDKITRSKEEALELIKGMILKMLFYSIIWRDLLMVFLTYYAMRSSGILYCTVYVFSSKWVTRLSTSGWAVVAATTKHRQLKKVLRLDIFRLPKLLWGRRSGGPAKGCRSGSPLAGKNVNFEI